MINVFKPFSSVFNNRNFNKYYISTIFLLLIVFLGSHIDCNSQLNLRNKKVLLPDKIINRQQPVLSNLLIVRFKPNYYLPNVGDFYKEFKAVGRLISPHHNLSGSKGDLPLRKKIDYALLRKAEDELIRSFIFEYDGNIPPELKAAKLLIDCSEIEIAEPYILYEPQGKFIPNDTLVPKQLMLETIKAFEAWDIFKGDTSIVIGISDTGVLQEHEDLLENIHRNYNEIPYNGIDDDINGYIDDYAGVNFSYLDDSTNPGSTFNKEGHGTLTVGISSATSNNITGLAGIGYNCRFFPMKAGINDTKYIFYGLQSIIYAGQNKLDVLNCSWGGPSYSCFAQSAVDYAVANDVAIVAAAGNHASFTPFYPAGYKGVLGVGVTDAMDTVIDMSATGAHVDIMAPGQGAITTNQLVGNDTVTSIYHISCCTSAASPIIAGAVALVRAKFPELSSQQALTHTRLSIDDISIINKTKSHLIPGRINLFKALNYDPFSKPGIEIIEYSYQSLSDGNTRFSVNDTFKIQLKLKNLLGRGQNIKIYLESVQAMPGSIELIDSTYAIESLESNQTLYLHNFMFRINKPSLNLMFFALNFEGEESYKDRILIPIIPGADYATFSNNLLKLSSADNGRIGFSDSPYNQRGEGFVYDGFCNTLFEGSFFATESNGKIVSQARNEKGKPANEFVSAKPFLEPDGSIALFWDGDALESDRIGLLVRNYVGLASNDTPCVRFELKLTNISDNIIEGLSAGYFFDWDLGADADSNIIRPFPESIPSSRMDKNTSSALIFRNGSYPYIGLMVSSDEDGALAQMISLRNDELFYDGIISNDQKRLFLNSGTDLFAEIMGEISMVAGMKFPKKIPPDSSATFSIVICSDKDLLSLIYLMKSFSGTIITDIHQNNKLQGQDFYLEHSIFGDYIRIKNFKQLEIEKILIYDVLGKLKKDMNSDVRLISSEIEIKTDNLPSGSYFILIKNRHYQKVFPIMIYK